MVFFDWALSTDVASNSHFEGVDEVFEAARLAFFFCDWLSGAHVDSRFGLVVMISNTLSTVGCDLLMFEYWWDYTYGFCGFG